MKKEHNLKEKFKGMFHTQTSKKGSYSAVLSVIVIAVAVVLNLVVGQLPEQYKNLDLSSQGLYSLSDTTKEMVAGIEDDITIYVLIKEDSADATLDKLLRRYEDLSEHVHVEYVDPDLTPNFISEHLGSVSSSISYNSLIVEGNGKSKLVDMNDIYPVDYYSYYTTGSYEETFNGEGAVTSAIDYVISEDIPKIYEVTGHGEMSLDSTITDLISQDNMELEEINLMNQESVPEDADALIIYAPTTDFSTEEADMVISYLENGGNVVVLTTFTTEDMTNFNRILDNYGLSVSQSVILEGDSAHSMQMPYYLIPNVEYHDITENISSSTNRTVFFPSAQPIVKKDQIRSTLEITDLLTTSDSAYLKTLNSDGQITTTEKEDGDQEGQFSVGVLATETNGDKETKLAVYSCGSMLAAGVSGNNSLFTGTLNYMCGQESSVDIEGKSTGIDSIMLTNAQVNLWSSVCMIGIPAALLITGFVVFMWRRKK